MPSRRLVLPLVLVLVLAGAGTAFALRDRGLPDDVAVRVQGHDITRADLTERSRSLQALYGVQQPASGAKRAAFLRDLAKAEVLALMVDRAARTRHVEVSSARTRSTLARYVTTQYGEGDQGREAFTQALADGGTSEKAVLVEVRRQLVVSALYDEVTGDVAAPTAREVDAAYEQRHCLFGTGPQRRLANIVVATRAEAEDVLRQLRGGTSFAAVARTTSLDGSTTDQGGELGFVTRDQLEKAYADLAFGARVGELFGPVQTRFGWNVGRVEAAKPATEQPRAKAEEALAQVLTSERRSAAWRTYITTLLRGAHAAYAPSYRPKDPVSPPSGMAGTTASKECPR